VRRKGSIRYGEKGAYVGRKGSICGEKKEHLWGDKRVYVRRKESIRGKKREHM
jgi:hypothetical protein